MFSTCTSASSLIFCYISIVLVMDHLGAVMLAKIHSKIAKVSQAPRLQLCTKMTLMRDPKNDDSERVSGEELLKELSQPLIQVQSVVRNLRITHLFSSLPPHPSLNLIDTV